MDLEARLASALAARDGRGIKRSLSPERHPQLDHPNLVDFSSNDYLSLATSPLLRKRLLSALDVSLVGPLGPSSSRLLDGNTPTHLALERQLSSFLSADAGLLFNSGFDANSGLWASLPAPDDFILYDALIHASTHDGMRLSRVPEKHRLPFRHNDYKDLEKVLRELRELDGVRSGVRTVWVAVETLYSMDGDLCPLTEMVEVVERVLDRGNGHVVVDEVRFFYLFRGTSCLVRSCGRTRAESDPPLKPGALDRPLRPKRTRDSLCPRPRQPDHHPRSHLWESPSLQRRCGRLFPVSLRGPPQLTPFRSQQLSSCATP